MRSLRCRGASAHLGSAALGQHKLPQSGPPRHSGGFFMSSSAVHAAPVWKRALFSELMLSKSPAARLAYIGVVTALCIAVNFVEIKFATTQFSFTIMMSALAGILIGPLFGFCATWLGDGIGYLCNSAGYPYYWWVALSCGCMALIAGLVMQLPMRGKHALAAKLALICALTFLVCSVGINSVCNYYIGLRLYMPSDVTAAAAEYFGGRLTFGTYLVIRYIFLLQILNSLVNDVLLVIAVYALRAAKPLKLDFDT